MYLNRMYVLPSQPDQKAGKVAELEDLRLGTQSLVTKKMLTPGRVTMPETVGCFTANLYYYKVSFYYFIYSYGNYIMLVTDSEEYIVSADGRIWTSS